MLSSSQTVHSSMLLRQTLVVHLQRRPRTGLIIQMNSQIVSPSMGRLYSFNTRGGSLNADLTPVTANGKYFIDSTLKTDGTPAKLRVWISVIPSRQKWWQSHLSTHYLIPSLHQCYSSKTPSETGGYTGGSCWFLSIPLFFLYEKIPPHHYFTSHSLSCHGYLCSDYLSYWNYRRQDEGCRS